MITAKRNVRPPLQILYIRSYCDQTPTTDNQFAITNRFPFLSPSLSILGTSLSFSVSLSIVLSVCPFLATTLFHRIYSWRRYAFRMWRRSFTPWFLNHRKTSSTIAPFGSTIFQVCKRSDQTWLKKRVTNNNQIYQDTKFVKYTFTIYHRWNFNRGNTIVYVHDYNAYSTILFSYHIFGLINPLTYDLRSRILGRKRSSNTTVCARSCRLRG